MKKFFTLFAAAFAVSAAFAQTTLIDYPASKAGIAVTGTSVEGTVKIHTNADAVPCFTLKNGYTAEGVYNNNSINLTTDGGFKAGDVITIAGAINNADESKRATAVIFTLDGTTPTMIHQFSDFINGRLVGDDPVVESYTLEADAAALYLGRDGGTGANLVKIQVVRPAGSEEPGDEPAGEPQGTPETFVAVSYDGEAYVANDLFVNAVIENGASTVSMSTANMDVVAVGGTTAKDVYQEAGTDFAGWTEWNDVKWDVKNQGDIKYGYILGTGNPAVKFDAEEVLTEEQRTGHYRPAYTFYAEDGSLGMPVMGLYYKFSPKVDGQLKVNVWSNKGNRNTFLVDEETVKPVKYVAEGYINAQNEGTGEFDENGNEIQRKKWLSAEEIQFIHDNAKCQKDADGNVVPGTDSAPWVIGAGNQPFWGTLTVNVKAGKSYWLFQHSSQIGFQSYTFTPNEATAISNVAAEKENVIFNLRGERVNSIVRGQMFIQNGQKVIIR